MAYDRSIIGEKSYAFALKIVKTYKELKYTNKEYELASQILRSGTSIGANVAEANGAISQADFSHKISISYKEAIETKYWLRLLKDSNYLVDDKFEELNNDIEEICRILFAILKKTRLSPELIEKK